MTAPYDPQVESLIRASFRAVWSVSAYNLTDAVAVPLVVTGAEVTMDEFWSPYVQGTVTAIVPESQQLLDALDARKKVRITLSAGYVLADGTTQLKPLAVTYLANRSVDRPGDTIRLSVQGKEYLHEGWEPLFPNAGWVRDLNAPQWGSTTPARDAVTRALLAAGAITGNDVPSWDGSDASWDYDGALQSIGWADSGDLWSPSTEPALPVARDIADRVGGWFRCDETGTWRLTKRPTLAGTARHQLAVGALGTIVASQTGLSRDGWANAVRVTYSWAGGGTAYGFAAAESGPYAVSAVGQMTEAVSYPWKGGTAAAQSRATSILRTFLSRGRSMDLDAVPAYWLRPGDTVTVQLPLGSQERHLVSSVAFALHEGSMRVTTRVPDNSTTFTTGGA